MSGSKSVLVVEDDERTREALTHLLRLQGYAACGAADGHEALDVLRRGPLPDCILLDLAMPRLDGRLFMVRQKRHPRWSAIPVELLSGSPRLAEEAALLGAADYLQKPVEPHALLEALRKNC
jgi:CheY-like chemotaxis protein